MLMLHKESCTSIGGNQYFLLIVDDMSRYIFLYLMRRKNQVSKLIKAFVRRMKVLKNKTVKTIRSDNGGEFVNKELKCFYEQEGITQQVSAPYTPQQNGVAERYNRTIMDMARTMLLEAKLPAGFWGEAVQHAAWIRNRCFSSAVNGKTPYQAWTGKKPDVSSLRVFGCDAFAHIPAIPQKDPGSRATPCIFLRHN